MIMTNNIKIERMKPDDADTYLKELKVFDDGEWAFEVFCEFINDPYGYFFKAYFKGELAGFISLYHNTLNEHHFCKVMDLRVIPDFRCKGIGRALMIKALDLAKKLKLDKVKLEVDTKNIAIELYKSLGFQIEKIEKEFYDDGADAYIMWRYE